MQIQARFRYFLGEATPAQRCILAINISIPFLLAFIAAQSVGLFVPAWREYLNPVWFVRINSALALCILVSLGLLAWLWPRRTSRRPLPGTYILVACVMATAFSLEAFLTGNLTHPTSIVIIGIIPCGLMLLDMRATAVALGLGITYIWLNDLAISCGLIPYAPGYRPAAFTGNEHAFMAEMLRSGILYVSVLAYIPLTWMLFDQYDHQRRELVQLSRHDMLTGLPNRRHFMSRLARECQRLARIHVPLCLVMVDADHFKRINDTHGHEAGDEVLKSLARLLAQHMRVPADLPARLGGEEFAILLPDTRLDGAVAVCERIAAQLQVQRFVGAGGQPFSLSLSMGVVEGWQLEAEKLLHQADANLYRAKAQGRNRIVASRLPPRAFGGVMNHVVDAAA